MTAISDDLVAAYRSTDYRIQLPGSNITLRIGRYSEPLAGLHAEYAVSSSAFLTAYNPYSKQASPESNMAVQRDLLAELEARDLKWIEGAGRDPSGKWPPEPSVLVLGIEYHAANDLAVKFEQNAFVFADCHAIPQLILTR